METLPYWKRPERWLAFFLTFLGVCSFLAIIQVKPTHPEILDAVASAPIPNVAVDSDSFIDNLRAGAVADQMHGHWTSLLSPLLAVIIAAYFRSMIAALLAAFFTGALLSYGSNPITTTFLAFHDFIYLNIVSAPRLYLFMFLFTLIGMVYVVSRNGGLGGLVDVLVKYAKGRRGAQVIIAISGVLAFFDDYVSTIMVGSTMRKLSDYWNISREKLAFLVDSTAAPVSGIAFISTWAAVNASLAGGQLNHMDIDIGGYEVLLQVLPMRFYCIGLLFFVFSSALSGRDFGSMLVAENRAANQGKVKGDHHQSIGFESSSSMDPESNVVRDWKNAVVPLAVVFLSTLLGVFVVGALEVRSTGEELSIFSFTDWRTAFSAASTGAENAVDAKVLPVFFFSAVLGGVVAIVITIRKKILTPRETFKTYVKGMPTMWMAIFILVMTWAMQGICETLGTGQYLIAILGDDIPVWAYPLFVFIISAGMSFAIGSGKGAIAILMPIVVPLAFQMREFNGANEIILFLTIAAILDGATFGDHCSPISDSTVLTSIATDCDHIAHVNTQLMYAVTTMALSGLFGYLSVARDFPIWTFYVAFPISSLAVLFLVGKRVRRRPVEASV